MTLDVAFNPPQFNDDKYDGIKMRQFVEEIERLHAVISETIIETDARYVPLYDLTPAEAAAGITSADVDKTIIWGDVRRYGWLGDNSANDTTALQNAINASDFGAVGSTTRHNRIKIPAGVGRVTNILAHVTSNNNRLIIEGAGIDNTVIRGTSLTGNVIDVTGDKIEFRNLSVDSTAARAAVSATTYSGSTPNLGKHGIAFIPANDSTTQSRNRLTNVGISGQPDDGVYARQPELLKMDNVWSFDNGRYGFHLNGFTNSKGISNYAINCRASGNSGRGWYVRSIVNSTFENSQSLTNGGVEEIYCHGGRNNIFLNPDIESGTFNTDQGLKFVGNLHQSIGGFFFNIQKPIVLSSADSCKITLPHVTNTLGTSDQVVDIDANSDFNKLELAPLSQYGSTTKVVTVSSSSKGNTLLQGGVLRELTTPSFSTSDATPSVLDGGSFKTADTTTYTDFDDAFENQVFTLLALHAATVTNGANIKTSTGANKTLTVGVLYMFKNIGGVWYENATA